jgi:uncharacterized protein (TIGR02996 family)
MAAQSARPEVLALLRAAKETPDDDTPRLVLADWLQENGDEYDAARGEFIRLQCERAGLPQSDWRARNLFDNETELELRHGEEWFGMFEGTLTIHAKERGLLCCTTRDVLPSSEALVALRGTEALAWVDGLSLDRCPPDRLRDMAAWGWLDEINHLTISGPGVAEALAVARLSLVTALNLKACSLHSAGAATLTRTAPANLRFLLLESNWFGDLGAVHLANWPALAGVERLHLGYNNLGPEGARALAASPHLKALRILQLDHCRIGDEGVEGLAASPILQTIECLSLQTCGFGDAGAAALVASPHLGRLERLFLGSDSAARLSPHARDSLRERFGDRITF